jgi:transposase
MLRVRHDGSELSCPQCGGANVVRRGTVPRSWQAPPIGNRPVTVFADVPRIECHDCHCEPVVPVRFADPRRSYTRSFERYVLDLRESMTLKDVARHVGVSEWTVRDIEKRWLGKHFAKPKLKKLRHIAIDEIATRKGHRYLTLVMDLKSGAVVHVGRGKGADALKPFWKRLKASHAKIKAVAMDMSSAYYRAVTENLPKAAVVFDWFHIVKLLNDKLSQLRRELYREAVDVLHKNVLKGTRWLLLKRPENLDKKKNEHRRLREALKLNESLATAYYLKEDLRLLWEQPDKRAAGRFLDDWIRQAEASGIRVLQTFARTLAMYRSGLLAWYDHPISTGPLEGTNNKIKTLKRQAYGFRDEEYFRLKILAIHHSRFELVG